MARQFQFQFQDFFVCLNFYSYLSVSLHSLLPCDLLSFSLIRTLRLHLHPSSLSFSSYSTCFFFSLPIILLVAVLNPTFYTTNWFTISNAAASMQENVKSKRLHLCDEGILQLYTSLARFIMRLKNIAHSSIETVTEITDRNRVNLQLEDSRNESGKYTAVQ